MPKIDSVQGLKESKASVKLAILSMLVIPLVGLGCLLFPSVAECVLPYFLGVPMILSGIGSILAAVRKGSEKDEGSVGAGIVLCILGAITVIHGSESTMFIGTIWGLLGLSKAAGEFDEIIEVAKAKERFVLQLLVCVFELVLSILLILNPFANIEHHLLLLGIELIIYPFTLHRKRGKFVIEADA